MANVKVSAGFSKAMSRKATAVEEARKAENTMMTCKMPVGWKGKAVVVDASADKAKDKKDDKGNTVEGNEYIRLDFNVVNDDHYAGAKFSIIWSFYDSEKATWADRFSWCLNGLENLGLPRDLRENYNEISEVLEFFTSNDEVYDAEVVTNTYRQGDQKEVKVRRAALVVDASDSISPEETKEDGKVATTESSGTLQVGASVKYMGKSYTVVAIEDDDVKIKSVNTGVDRTVKVAQLDS
jgi:hypothetical protein